MYIEEMIIEDYMQRLNNFENASEEEQLKEGPPAMPQVVQHYHELGELWLDDRELEEEIAPDILGISPDILG